MLNNILTPMFLALLLLANCTNNSPVSKSQAIQSYNVFVKIFTKPEAGTITDYYQNINSKTGLPLTEPYSVTIWAHNSVMAIGLAEIASAMGEIEARHWMTAIDETASFYAINFEDSYISKADMKMSLWISSANN